MYVEGGGILVSGWPHLSLSTNRDDIALYRHRYIDHKLTSLLGGQPLFREFATDSGLLYAAENINPDGEALVTTKDGTPLILRYAVGKGQIYFINVREYPGNAAARPLYERVLAEVCDQTAKTEPCRIVCGNDVGWTAFKQDDGSFHLYVIAVDWYNTPAAPRRAELVVGKERRSLEIPFGSLVKVVVSSGREPGEYDILIETE